VATFVIVHGAFGGGWQWREVASLLRERGHLVFTPSLTGFGERVHLAIPQTGLYTHIDDICNLIRFEDLHDVVLACQSYGGMVATGVMDRMPERLSHLIYLNALVPRDGQSAFDLLPAAMREHFETSARASGDGWRIPPPPLENDPIVAAFARGRHVPSLMRMFQEPVRLEPHPDVPRTYVWCTDDPAGLAGVADLMLPFAERAQREPGWRFHRLATPPDAFIHAPGAVADIFEAAARSG